LKTLTPEQKAKRAEQQRKRIDQLRLEMRKDVEQLRRIIRGKQAIR